MRNFDDSYGVLGLNALKDPINEQDDPSADDPFIAWNEDFTSDFVAILKGMYQRYPRKKN